MTTPNGTFIMLRAVITTGVTPRGIRKPRYTRGPLVAGDAVQGVGWHICVGGRESVPTARCKRQRELMQGGLC